MPTRLSVSPASIARACYSLALRRAARAVSRRYDEALSPLDLSNGQFSMLAVIAGHQPVRIQTLADELAMDRTTVTAALKPLERRRLVAIAVSPADPRGRDASLTRAGEGLLARAIPIWQALQDEVGAHLPGATGEALRKSLSRLA